MDIQASFRSIDLTFSDNSSIEAEVYFKFSTGDKDSIANQLLENLIHTSLLDPMEGIILAMMSEDNLDEDEEIDADLEDQERVGGEE
jgi:hypothetical protein